MKSREGHLWTNSGSLLYLARIVGRFLPTFIACNLATYRAVTPELLRRGCHVSVVVKSVVSRNGNTTETSRTSVRCIVDLVCNVVKRILFVVIYEYCSEEYNVTVNSRQLTFWRRNYFFLTLAHSVYKM